MYVCICRAVRDKQILNVIQDGARTVDAVEAACGAGGDCGSCREEIADMIAAHEDQARSAACATCPNAQRDNHAPRAA
jgi:bacterioferritin-associated ferredoxin